MARDTRFLDLVGVEHPIIQAPMIGPKGDLTASVSEAGGLGSLGCAAMSPEQVRSVVAAIRQRTAKPLNLNFFCHAPAPPDAAREAGWRAKLAPYYDEFRLDPASPIATAVRTPFDEAMCDLIVELRPRVVSFHFGLPDEQLLRRVKEAGCVVLSSATTVREARWLEAHGVNAIIAQGAEAGGHRGMFLTEAVASQVGTIALVPRVVDAVAVPVIAAGGIADARGVAAAFALGACAVQVGTAFLLCPESGIPAVHRDALRNASEDETALTNVFTGRPARGIVNRVMRDLGPISPDVPAFPTAAIALQPLRADAEARGSGDFSPLWSGQGVGLAREIGAAELTHQLAGGARRSNA